MDNENIRFNCITDVQLRLVDLDTMGHINNAVYFNLMDLAKSDYFSKVTGVPQDPNRISVMIVNINCNFMAQTFFHEPIAVRTATVGFGDKSMRIAQEVFNKETGEVKCSCSQVLVYVDPDTHIPERVPDRWRQLTQLYENQQ